MKLAKEALERLIEAESFIGSPVNVLFLDDVNPNYRQQWLNSVREILRANKIKPENLVGKWQS